MAKGENYALFTMRNCLLKPIKQKDTSDFILFCRFLKIARH
jgi:hypothetical protein